MQSTPGVLVGKGEEEEILRLEFANRHGLIAGATGTGKTVTLQVLAEGLSKHGIPVFLADVKGDLAGISQPGTAKPALMERAASLGITDYSFQGYPTVFWDLFAEQGHPIRATHLGDGAAAPLTTAGAQRNPGWCPERRLQGGGR